MLEFLLSEYLVNAFILIALAIVAAVSYMFGMKYEQKVNTDEKERIAAGIVKYVQQVYDALDGDEKKKIAILKLRDILAEYKIHVSEEEIDILIEKSVYEMKKAFEAGGDSVE